MCINTYRYMYIYLYIYILGLVASVEGVLAISSTAVGAAASMLSRLLQLR